MKYLVTVGWEDPQQPLKRCKSTLTVEIENIENLEAYDIVEIIKKEFRYTDAFYADVVIDFMMPLSKRCTKEQ